MLFYHIYLFRFSFGNERRARFWRSKIYGRSSLQNGRISENKKKYAYQYLIEMDGGINNENFQLIKKAGCDIIVVGSYLFQQDNLYTTIKELEE